MIGRSQIWHGVVHGGSLAGRHFTLTERDGTDVYVISHTEPGRRETMVTLILRGDAGLEAFLREHDARIEWRRLWRSQASAA
ncbi:MAG: hypothetical protein U1F43_09785 [Myxococcota bacterium]